VKIPLSAQIDQERLLVSGFRDQAVILRKRGADALADQALYRRSVAEATLRTLEWLERNQDAIRAAVAARSTVDAE
jgi:hypothetical protein